MEVLALIGSPRKQGNTDIMADEVLEGAKTAGATTSKIYLDDYQVRPIAEVADNTRQRDDPRRDDDFPLLLERFLSADVIVWKGHVVLCAFGRPEQRHGEWITKPMELTVEVLHGIYLGDVCASVYQKGKVRQMPEVLEACRKLGTNAVSAIREQRG